MIIATETKIHTFSVTIQSLTLKDRQMTLAVFRQLPQGRFYENTNGQRNPILGTPWGLVRYDIKDQGYLWIVHEHDGVLYRCSFPVHISLWTAKDAITELNHKINTLERESEWLKSSKDKIPGIRKDLDKAKLYLERKIIFNAEMDILISELNKLPQLFIAV